MKKILILLLISGSVLSASAQTPTPTRPTNNPNLQTDQHQYYFYPSQNVYYDKVNRNYWFNKSLSDTTWTQGSTLPSNVNIDHQKSYPIHYKGTDPWKNNTNDLKKYKAQNNGAVNIKTKKGHQ